MSKVYSVLELNNYIKNLFEDDYELSSLTVKGEISNFINHRSGHMYFSLKDGESQIKAIMFRSANARLKFMPSNGMKVVVKCSVNAYIRDGVYQLYVNSMEKDGVGDLYLAFEELKSKLHKEGLFSEQHKKAIPYLPKRIGVITSSTGAAIRDIINVIQRRCPISKIVLYPAIVQGAETETSLIQGLDYFERVQNVDVVIIGRGGGSIEDLWGFNSEKLARRIFEFNIPIISGVGHEIDFTICDFVADKRAPTPSAAAELVVPDLNECNQYLDVLSDRLFVGVNNFINRKEQKLRLLETSAIYRNPERIIHTFEQNLLPYKDKLYDVLKLYLKKKDYELGLLTNKLDDLSPLKILGRGYSIVSNDVGRVSSIEKIKLKDNVHIRFTDGEATAEIKEVKEIK